MYDLSGRRVIITGAAQGFGKEFARRLLQEGSKVCISDVDETKGNETKALFQKQFGVDDSGLCFFKCDVSKKEDWLSLWDNAEKSLEGSIDILVNNAGVHPGTGWQLNLNVNLYGVGHGTFLAIEKMGASHGGRGGRIVNVASVAGITNGGLGPIDNFGYNMAKQGVVALTKGFKNSEPNVYDQENIKCYGLCPWYADTKLVRDGVEMSNTGDSKWKYKGQTIDSMEKLAKVKKMRILNVHEVGHALIKSLEYDKNGAIYVILPDSPLIEYPINQTKEFLGLALASKFASNFNVELFTYKHFIAIILGAILLAYHIFLTILGWIF